MAVFAEAYGIAMDEDLVAAVVTSQHAGVQRMIDLAALGRPRQVELIATGELEREHRAVEWTRRHRHKFSLAGSQVGVDA
jgi:Arc/MetJ family transcription regulator